MSAFRFIQQRPGRGFGLVEVLLALGVIAVMTAAIWLVFGPTSVAAQVKETQLDFSQTAKAIDRSMGLLGGYSGLTTTRVNADGLAADRLRKNGALANAWGGTVSFASYAVKRGNDAFLVETRDVPIAACARLVAAMAADPAIWDAQVDGESVYVAGRYDPATAAAACQAKGGARLGFVYFSGLAAGSSVAAPPLALPPPPPSVAPVDPVGSVSPVPGAPGVGDVAPGTPVLPAPAPPAPAVPSPPPLPPAAVTPMPTTPQPALPPTALPPVSPVAACQVPSPATRTEADSRTVGCPAGQLGNQTQTRQRSGTYACPEAWAAPVLTWGEWAAWTTTSSACAPACVASPPTSTAITRAAPAESQNVGCPAGQVGQHWQQRNRVENGNRTTSWACPAATGSPVSSTSESWSGTFTASSGWVTTANTCMTPAPPAKTYPSYSGNSWVSWGDGGLYGWGVFCSPSQYYANQTHCTQSVNTNDDATFSPVLPQEQALTSERRTCVAALQQRLTPMPGFGYTPSNGPVDWPSECACEVVGAGSAFYWQVTGASDWSAYEFKCP